MASSPAPGYGGGSARRTPSHWSPHHPTSPTPYRTDSSASEMEPDEQEGLEPDLDNTSHMNFVDGRCSCCPYGYHVDVDFLRYLEGMNSGVVLKNLKKIHRNKKKLRKSMEVFLEHQKSNEFSSEPPDVVHSSEAFMNIVEEENTAANQILEEIDSSVTQTLSSIDLLMTNKKTNKRPSSSAEYLDEVDSRYYNNSAHGDQRYRSETEFMLSSPTRQLAGMGKSDSISSLSSQSTYSSEVSPSVHSTSNTNYHISTTNKTTILTSTQLANNMASLLPEDGHVAMTTTSSSDLTTISSSTLQAIREQMAVSLQRMRELEEQVKALPVLQVRISVLKEEKRLLALQLKAKQCKANTRSIGVSNHRLDDEVEEYIMPGQSPKVASRPRLGWLNGELPKPKPAMRTVGVGEGNVFDNYQLQPSVNTMGTRYHEKEFHKEQTTEIHEKEVKTVFLGQSSTDTVDSSHMNIMSQRSLSSSQKPEKKTPPERPPRRTRSVGTGDDNVFDNNSNLHVHEKELRTVFIGNEEDKQKSTRNVGILCKTAMRDVGVMCFYEDEKPVTRNIAVGVGEIGVGEGYFGEGALEQYEGGELGEYSSATGTHITHTALQQMNLAALYTKHIHIRPEHLRIVLDQMLKKTVHSVGVQCRFATVDKNIGHSQMDLVGVAGNRSIGCGDDSIDVVIHDPIPTRSIGVENRPILKHRLIGTETGYKIDAATNTMSQTIQITRSSNTDHIVTYPAAVNTDHVSTSSTSTGTDIKIFQALDQVRNAGVNTPIVNHFTQGTNTESSKMLGSQNADISITFAEKGAMTEPMSRKHLFDRGTCTEAIRQFSRGSNTTPPRTVERGVAAIKPQCPSTGVNTVPPSTVTRGVGDCVLKTPQTSTGSGGMAADFEQQIPKKRTRVVGTSTEKTWTQNVGVGNYDIHKDEAREQIAMQNQQQVVEQEQELITLQQQLREIHEEKEIELQRLECQLQHFQREKEQEERRVHSMEMELQQIHEEKVMMEQQVMEERQQSMDERQRVIELEEEKVLLEQRIHQVSQQWEQEQVDYSTVQSQREQLEHELHMKQQQLQQQQETLELQRKEWEVEEERRMQQVSASQQEAQRKQLEHEFHLKQQQLQQQQETLELRRKEWEAEEERRMQQVSVSQQECSEEQVNAVSIGETEILPSESTTTTDAGGTQMRVIRHIETTFVGGKPVKRSSNVVLRDGSRESSPEDVSAPTSDRSSEERTDSHTGGSQTVKTTTTTRMTHGGTTSSSYNDTVDNNRSSSVEKEANNNNNNVFESSPSESEGKTEYSTTTSTIKQPAMGKGRKIVITETRIERKVTGEPGSQTVTTTTTKSSKGSKDPSLKSIMKRSSNSAAGKKGIKFSEEVVGGYVSSSDEEGGEHVEGEDSDGSQSSVSFDEGSYDGRLGQISYSCKDDETIAEGQPGASMYDQNIREIYELTDEMQASCEVYAQWLEDSTQINSKQLNAAENTIQAEWFRVSSHKLSNPSMVEDYLSCLNEISTHLLTHVINMCDTNGNTALHYAISHCNMEVVNLLLDTDVMDINKQNQAGYTAIMLASLAQIQGDRMRDIIRRLFALGDVNSKASQAGQTALMLAVSHGRVDMVRMLLETGAHVNEQDEDGSTALMCASEHGHTDIVKLLLGHPDSDPTVTDNDGSTALSIAMEAGHRDIGVLLYAHVNFRQGSPVLGRKSKRRSSSNSPASPSPLKK